MKYEMSVSSRQIRYWKTVSAGRDTCDKGRRESGIRYRTEEGVSCGQIRYWKTVSAGRDTCDKGRRESGIRYRTEEGVSSRQIRYWNGGQSKWHKIRRHRS